MISVCMIVYNGEKYVFDQINSILKQLSAQDELIISDDGSSDKTVGIIEGISDNRIKLFKNNNFKNPTFNMENALKHASGDIIFLSDQDDIWLDDKVQVSLNYLEKYDYIVSDCYLTDANLNITANTRFVQEAKIAKNKYLALIKPTPYQGSCAAFKRNVLLKSLPFPSYIQSHDRWVGYIASFFFNHALIDEKLILYRRHDANASTSSTGKSKNSVKQKVIFRFGYIYALLKKI